jgi:2'-5' RNA ligase
MAGRIPDEALAMKGRTDNPHITIKYGLLEEGSVEVMELVREFGPVDVVLGKTSVFVAGNEERVNQSKEQYDVVKIDVDGLDLHKLHQHISQHMPNKDEHIDYHPHITLAYVLPGRGKEFADWTDLNGLRMTFNEMVFTDKRRKETVIPLLRNNLTLLDAFKEMSSIDWTAGGSLIGVGRDRKTKGKI